MPPTHTFGFSTRVYGNNKWVYDTKKAPGDWSGYGRPDGGIGRGR
jgi:hypothetical protein